MVLVHLYAWLDINSRVLSLERIQSSTEQGIQMKNKRFLAIAASMVVLTACDSGGGVTVSESQLNTDNQPLPQELRGRWTSSCHTREDIAPEYVVETLSMTGDTMVQEKRFYEDSGCTVAVDVESGHYYHCVWDLGAQTVSVRTAEGDAVAIDLSIRLASQDGVAMDSVIGDTEYNIVKLSNGVLQFGDTLGDEDGVEAADRPQTLYSENYYPG